jgi:hypothetical protein
MSQQLEPSEDTEPGFDLPEGHDPAAYRPPNPFVTALVAGFIAGGLVGGVLVLILSIVIG